MDDDICVYVIPEDGSEPIKLTQISDVVFETDAYYAYCNQSDLPHVALFSDDSFEFTFRIKRDIEKELPPRYFKKNKENNLTCVWMDRKRAIGMLRDLDRWAEFVKLLKNEMKGGLK